LSEGLRDEGPSCTVKEFVAMTTAMLIRKHSLENKHLRNYFFLIVFRKKYATNVKIEALQEQILI